MQFVEYGYSMWNIVKNFCFLNSFYTFVIMSVRWIMWRFKSLLYDILWKKNLFVLLFPAILLTNLSGNGGTVCDIPSFDFLPIKDSKIIKLHIINDHCFNNLYFLIAKHKYIYEWSNKCTCSIAPILPNEKYIMAVQ